MSPQRTQLVQSQEAGASAEVKEASPTSSVTIANLRLGDSDSEGGCSEGGAEDAESDLGFSMRELAEMQRLAAEFAEEQRARRASSDPAKLLRRAAGMPHTRRLGTRHTRYTHATHTRHTHTSHTCYTHSTHILHTCYTHATEYERAQLEDTAQLAPPVILRGLLSEEELRSVSDHAEQLCAATCTTAATGGTGSTGAGAERWVPCGEAHRKLFLHAVGDGGQRTFGAACPLLLAKLVRRTI